MKILSLLWAALVWAARIVTMVLAGAAAIAVFLFERLRAPVLEIAGAVLLVIAGWQIFRPLGLAIAGFACLVASVSYSSTSTAGDDS